MFRWFWSYSAAAAHAWKRLVEEHATFLPPPLKLSLRPPSPVPRVHSDGAQTSGGAGEAKWCLARWHVGTRHLFTTGTCHRVLWGPFIELPAGFIDYLQHRDRLDRFPLKSCCVLWRQRKTESSSTYTVRHNYRNASCNWRDLVNVQFIWTNISDNIAEEMLNLRVWK